VAYSLVAQFGVYLMEGHGQLVFKLSTLLGGPYALNRADAQHLSSPAVGRR